MKALCKGFLILSLSIFGVNNNYNTFNVLDGLTPGDSSVPSTWGQEKIQLNEALNLSNPSKKVKIGLIDSGIDSEYEKLNKLINYNKGKDYIFRIILILIQMVMEHMLQVLYLRL